MKLQIDIFPLPPIYHKPNKWKIREFDNRNIIEILKKRGKWERNGKNNTFIVVVNIPNPW